MRYINFTTSSDPRFLAGTDILIGDMSDINYEFLLFNRPIILLANKWLKKNFPDIGIKTDLNGLPNAIERCIKWPDEYEYSRKYWLKKTIYKPDGKTSRRVIDEIIKQSKIFTPYFIILHDNCNVKKSNLLPLIDEVKKRNADFLFQDKISEDYSPNQTDIIIAAHFNGLK